MAPVKAVIDPAGFLVAADRAFPREPGCGLPCDRR